MLSIAFITFTILASNFVTLNAQQRHRTNRAPILTEISNKAVVQSIFPEATRVEKTNDYWYRILDKNNRKLGYAMNSSEFSKNIAGYKGPTPVMIITDRRLIIRHVAILSHYETPSYIQLLEQAGYFNSWNNLTLQNALKVTPDGWSGATITADAVNKNVHYLLENGIQHRPDRRSRRR